jgi:4-amino-4-deoxy-L-arabinose transferase-like glycosyltransferase
MSGSRRDLWLLGAILLFALVMRAAYLIEITEAPDFDRPQFESQYHDYWARALVSGDWTPPEQVTDPEISTRPYFRPPGYPFFLAAALRIGGDGYLWPRIVQMFLGLVSCLMIGLLTRRWFGWIAGLGAAALFGGYWAFIYFEGEFMAPPLLILLTLAVLGLVSRWADEMTLTTAAAAGVATGLAALVRPNLLALAPFFLLWAVWVRWRRGGREAVPAVVRNAAVYLCATILAILPATLRNHRVSGDWVLVTSNAGINLFIGLHPDSDGTTPGVPELAELTGMEGWDSFDYPLIAENVERIEGREMSDSEVSRWFARQAVSRALERPGAVVRLIGRKILLFWGPAEISNTKVIHHERQASRTLRSSPGFATILALSLVGIAVCAVGGRWGWETAETASERPDPAVVALLVGFVVVYASTYAPFFVSARFRLPVIPVLMVFGGVAIQTVWRLASARRWGLLTAVLVGFGLLRLAAGHEWVAYEPDASLWHWRRGLLFERSGRIGKAMDEYRAAVEIRPDHAEAQLSMAEAYAGTGDPDRAIRHYEEHMRLRPDSPAGMNGLALVLAQTGRLDEAMDLWERTLAIAPADPAALNNLATALLVHPVAERRDPARALALAERGVEATGGRDPDLLRTLELAARADGRAPAPLLPDD